MPYIKSKSQQLVKPAMNPVSTYSRVIACRSIVTGDGGWHWSCTRPIGIDFWLLSVRVWTTWSPADGSGESNFKIYFGKGQPTGTADIQAWSRLDPVYGKEAIHTYKFYNRDKDFWWTMKRLFTGQGYRFGLLAKADIPIEGRVMAAFEISEG